MSNPIAKYMAAPTTGDYGDGPGFSPMGMHYATPAGVASIRTPGRGATQAELIDMQQHDTEHYDWSMKQAYILLPNDSEPLLSDHLVFFYREKDQEIPFSMTGGNNVFNRIVELQKLRLALSQNVIMDGYNNMSMLKGWGVDVNYKDTGIQLHYLHYPDVESFMQKWSFGGRVATLNGDSAAHPRDKKQYNLQNQRLHQVGLVIAGCCQTLNYWSTQVATGTPLDLIVHNFDVCFNFDDEDLVGPNQVKISNLTDVQPAMLDRMGLTTKEMEELKRNINCHMEDKNYELNDPETVERKKKYIFRMIRITPFAHKLLSSPFDFENFRKIFGMDAQVIRVGTVHKSESGPSEQDEIARPVAYEDTDLIYDREQLQLNAQEDFKEARIRPEDFRERMRAFMFRRVKNRLVIPIEKPRLYVHLNVSHNMQISMHQASAEYQEYSQYPIDAKEYVDKFLELVETHPGKNILAMCDPNAQTVTWAGKDVKRTLPDRWQLHDVSQYQLMDYRNENPDDNIPTSKTKIEQIRARIDLIMRKNVPPLDYDNLKVDHTDKTRLPQFTVGTQQVSPEVNVALTVVANYYNTYPDIYEGVTPQPKWDAFFTQDENSVGPTVAQIPAEEVDDGLYDVRFASNKRDGSM